MIKVQWISGTFRSEAGSKVFCTSYLSTGKNAVGAIDAPRVLRPVLNSTRSRPCSSIRPAPPGRDYEFE